MIRQAYRPEQQSLLAKLENQVKQPKEIVDVRLTKQEINFIIEKVKGPVIVEAKVSPSLQLRKKAQVLNRLRVMKLEEQRVSASTEDTYTVQEVAELFGVTRQAVYKWIDSDKIKYIRRDTDSRDIRIPKAQFKVRSRKQQFQDVHKKIFGEGPVELVDPSDVFRSGAEE